MSMDAHKWHRMGLSHIPGQRRKSPAARAVRNQRLLWKQLICITNVTNIMNYVVNIRNSEKDMEVLTTCFIRAMACLA